MANRDDRHRRAAARLHEVAVDLAAEVLAKGGSLGWYDLTDAERAEAREKATRFWPERMRDLSRRTRENVARSRRMGRPPSTEP